MDESKREQVALFRFSVIGSLISGELSQNFCSHDIDIACAAMKCALIHSTVVCRTMPKEIREAYNAYCAIQKAVDSLRNVFDIEFTALENQEINLRMEKEIDTFDF